MLLKPVELNWSAPAPAAVLPLVVPILNKALVPIAVLFEVSLFTTSGGCVATASPATISSALARAA